MLRPHLFVVPDALFEGLEQETPPAEAIDGFNSELAAAYERVLQKGVSPSSALGAMLEALFTFATPPQAKAATKTNAGQSCHRPRTGAASRDSLRDISCPRY